MTMRSEAPIIEKGPWKTGTTPFFQIKDGGQWGLAENYNQWISNGAFVRQNLIPVVLRLPRGMYMHPQSADITAIFKNLIELQQIRWQGFNQTLRVEVVTNAIGGSGEMQADPVNVTREISNITSTMQEREYRAGAFAFNWWWRELIMDESSKIAAINFQNFDSGYDRLPDFHSAVVMFIEPDKTHRRVVTSYLMGNFFPSDGANIESGRDVSNSLEAPQHTITWQGFAQVGWGVDALAQRLLDEIVYTGANPMARQAFVDDIDAETRSADGGYMGGVEDVRNGAITP